MTIRLVDVAERARVSVATVSRVLAGNTSVNDELRSRVTAAVEELGYQPSRVARSLRGKRAQIIGVIISDIQNPFFTGLVRAVEDIASEQEFALFLCNTDEDPQKERMYLDLMLAEKVAGVVISPTQEENREIQRMQTAGVPMVVVDRRVLSVDLDTVLINNRQAASDLVAHLVAQGHRRIGAVLGDPHITTGRERYEGYRNGLAAAELPEEPGWVYLAKPIEENGYLGARQILQHRPRPTALITGNNLLAEGALRAIQELGYRVPDDVALATFDDVRWMSLHAPGITAVRLPTYALGRAAAELLFRQIDEGEADGADENGHREVLLEYTIILRDSTNRIERG